MLQDHVAQIQKATLEDLTKGQEKIYSALVTDHQPNRVPESIFVNYFLPGFMGQNTDPNWMLQWISIAGSPSAEVTVFDNASGRELFRVPGVLSTRTVMLPGGEGGLDDIFKRHDMMAGTLGGSRTQFLFSSLGEKSQQALKDQDHTVLGRWRDILARYGMAKVHFQQPPAGSTGDDLFDFGSALE